ncbi:hypothetical protein jhhlp_002917 [Lomentospora prolificans]|uniref:Heterokaryon incompatibility domain-containing protein n=1 Tax=Lomentospora prolificans TaxID=41688 RepID=A0A2N3NF97_9PEZI|nr:hypothetical protein jhhlp_002917 [Lomentospora prolificans]
MTYQYQPLQGAEIRLLTLEPLEEDSDAASPIRCRLEHANLPLQPEQPEQRRFKGDNYVWPESYTACDGSVLFQTSTSPKWVPTTIPESVGNSSLSAENELPWRFDWGDYMALSYVWGSPEPHRTIFLNGAPFSVGPNLFDALLLLRRSQRIRQGFKLWVDAICVNQADIIERSVQVGRMRDIYASAWHVVTFLGADADDSELAVAAIRWIGAQIGEAKNPLDELYGEPIKVNLSVLGNFTLSPRSALREEVYRALFYLLIRPYWRRMWILQEVAMARADAPVACGNTYLTWALIFGAAKFIELDEGRFDRDIVSQSRQKRSRSPYEFARGRLVDEEWSSEGTWKLLLDMQDLQLSQAQSPGSVGSEPKMDILRLLSLARRAKITDDKDRAYGVLGLRMIAERITMLPDYTLPMPVIYQNFMQELLSKGDLNILRLASRHRGAIYSRRNFGHRIVINGKPVIESLLGSASKKKELWIGDHCLHELPSWAVCWACKPAPTAELVGCYRAAGDASPSPPIFSDSTLQVQGIIVDTITSLGSFHPTEVDATYPINTSQPPGSIYGDLEATRAAFWRTVVGNTTAKGGGPAPESYASLLNRRIWEFGLVTVESNGFGLHEIMARNKQLVLSGYKLEELAFDRKESSSWLTRKEEWKVSVDKNKGELTEVELEAMSWAMNVLAWRRLAGTKMGRMGLACADAKIGDSIALLVGCDVPMALRRREDDDGWVVVGECYIHGIMNGEAFDNSDDIVVSDITLH